MGLKLINKRLFQAPSLKVDKISPKFPKNPNFEKWLKFSHLNHKIEGYKIVLVS